MSQDAKLSAEEIEALLSRNSQDMESEADTILSDAEGDAIGEIGNISFGTAATTLSSLLHHRVEITTPDVQVVRLEDVQGDFPIPYVVVTVEYTEGLSGANALAIEIDDAKTIADLMMGGDGTNVAQELNELHLSAVAEAMNQMMGGAATAMSSMFNRTINISPPTVKFVDFATGDRPEVFTNEWVVNTSFRLRVGQLIDSRIMQWVPLSFARELLQLAGAAFGTMATGAAPEAPSQMSTQSQFVQPAVHHSDAPTPRTQAHVQSDSELQSRSGQVTHLEPVSANAAHSFVDSTSAQQMVAAASAVNYGNTNYGNMNHGNYGDSSSRNAPYSSETRSPSGREATVSVQRPQFQDFEDREVVQPSPRNLSLLFDVQLNVTVELGRTKRPIRELLELAPGSILELDKLAGEPVDILVNNKRIAIGEVVVIDENFGVRVTDILSPAERVRSFQN